MKGGGGRLVQWFNDSMGSGLDRVGVMGLQ